MGPGETILSPSSPREKIFDVDARIFNFEIDVAGPLKSEHVRFLREQVLPAVQANPGATIILVGSASRSGPEAHNLGLSRRRAEEVQKILAPVNSQILDFSGGARRLADRSRTSTTAPSSCSSPFPQTSMLSYGPTTGGGP